MSRLKLSILDQSPVRAEGTAEQAIQETILLAQKAEVLGYTRFWVSEHHNISFVAGSAPEVLIAHLAAVTKYIRLGSGGIMLPNHSALKVAENFRLLEILAPGRVDLGVGRAPGGDRVTASLLNPSNRFDGKEYVRQLDELQHYFNDTAATSHGRVIAVPTAAGQPPVWMLTSSGESAYLAAELGLGLTFAQFINAHGAAQAIREYKSHFKASPLFPEPKAFVALWVVIAETEEVVRQNVAILQHRILQIEKGDGTSGLQSYEAIKDYPYTDSDRFRLEQNSGRMVAGRPEQVKAKLEALAEDCGIDEVMAVIMAYGFEDKVKSYELLAETFELKGR